MARKFFRGLNESHGWYFSGATLSGDQKHDALFSVSLIPVELAAFQKRRDFFQESTNDYAFGPGTAGWPDQLKDLRNVTMLDSFGLYSGCRP